MITNEAASQSLVDVSAAIGANIDAAVAARAGLRLTGYSIRESDGTPAVAAVEIVNGATGAWGTSIAQIELAASTSETVWFGDSGIDCSYGISLNWTTGTVDINFFYK